MTSRRTSLDERYEITPSLLNSWGWIWDCENYVRYIEEKDTICFEDKVELAKEKAKEDFLKALNREHSEPNEFMLAGIKFEQDCYDGNTCISPIIDGGCYQITGFKDVSVNGMNFLMVGRLDVLKGGTIYDIKRIQRYTLPKYKNSYQHGFYLDLFENAYKFEYLAYDGIKLHRELYYKDNCRRTTEVIAEFIEWLKENNLLEVYKKNWKVKGEN